MELLWIAILTLFASSIGTLTGFGTSTIMVPILLLFLPLPQALFLVGIIHWFGNVWKIVLFRKGIRWKLLLAFGIPGIVASYLGASLIFVGNQAVMSRILGSFLVVYVIFLFLKSSFKLPQSTITACIGGSASGFMAGIFGIGGSVRGMFLTAFNLPKEVYITTAGAIALCIDSSRLISYFTGGATLEKTNALGLLLFVPISFIGAYIAKKIVNKIPQQYFRYVIATFLFLVGLKLIIKP